MKRRYVAIFPVVIVLALVGTGIARQLSRTDEEQPGSGGVAVIVGHLERRTIEEILRYPGTLSPKNSVTIVPKIGGRVDKIHVFEGDRVVPDQLLVSIDSETLQLQLDQAFSAWQASLAQYRQAESGVRDEERDNLRATIAQAEEDVDVANRNYERSKRLYDSGAIPRAKLEEAEAAQRSANTSLDNAKRSLKLMEDGASANELDAVRANAGALEAQYELAKLQFRESLVRAPSYGTVARILVDPGNLVSPGIPMLALVSQDPIYLKIAIPEKHYRRFAVGSDAFDVRIKPVALEEEYAGAVTSVAPVIDPGSRTFVVEATIPNKDGRLKPGMYVNAEIVIRRLRDVIAVPENAVVLRDDVPVVFVTIDGNSVKASMRPVQLGIRTEGYVEILSGLDGSEYIVIDGNAFLEDGQTLRIVETE